MNNRYSPTTINHFLHPRNVGAIENPDGIGQVGDALCGDAVKMSIRVVDGKIAEARFRAFGCPAAIAIGSVVTELAKGRTLEGACTMSEKEIAAALGGLPEAKLHCSGMAIGALENCVKYFRRRNPCMEKPTTNDNDDAA